MAQFNTLTVSGPSTLGGDTVCNGKMTAAAFYQNSDERLKDIQGTLDKERCYKLLDICTPIIYTLHSDNKEQVGLIAQQVQGIFPELVTTDKEGFLAIDYSRLAVILMVIVKDLLIANKSA